MRKRSIYLVGSLRNQQITVVAKALREQGHQVFDDWISPGPETDDFWQSYEKERGRTFLEALNGHHAKTVFKFDVAHLHQADTTILVAPCGKSGHLELGYQIGRGMEGHILLPGEPERFDVMMRFAHSIWTSLDDLINGLADEVRNVI